MDVDVDDDNDGDDGDGGVEDDDNDVEDVEDDGGVEDDDIDNDDAENCICKEKMCLGQYRAIQCASFVYSQLNRLQVAHRTVQCLIHSSVYCTQDQSVMSLCVLHCSVVWCIAVYHSMF